MEGTVPVNKQAAPSFYREGTAPKQEVSREGERILTSQSKSLHCNRVIGHQSPVQ